MSQPQKITLLSAASATGGNDKWSGGPATFAVHGTWNGATAKLQYSPDGGTNFIDIQNASFTSDNVVNVTVPQGRVRTAISGGASPSLSAYLTELPISPQVPTVPLTINLTATHSVGASGTAGTLDVYPATASKGKTEFTAADNSGDTTTTITTAAQAAARTYTVPDAGADASFVMTTGAQTVSGVKTITTPIIASTTVGALPAGTAGQIAYVTDGDAALAWGATAVNSGAGATKYLVWFNGTNWTVAGK